MEIPSTFTYFVAPKGAQSGMGYQSYLEDSAEDSHEHNTEIFPSKPIDPWRLGKHLAIAASLFALGRGLHSKLIPEHAIPITETFSLRWKEWTRPILGMFAVSQVNQGLNWEPPPWLAAIESVAIINPLVVAKMGVNTVWQVVATAPVVASMVQATHLFNESVGDYLEENFNIPQVATRLVSMLGMLYVGQKIFPKYYEWLDKKGILKDKSAAAHADHHHEGGKCTHNHDHSTHEAKNATKSLVGSEVGACGCCATPICIRDFGNFLGSFKRWFKTDHSEREERQ